MQSERTRGRCLLLRRRSFDGDGRGTKLNVKGRRDPKADIAVFECRENAGRIEAWIEPAP